MQLDNIFYQASGPVASVGIGTAAPIYNLDIFNNTSGNAITALRTQGVQASSQAVLALVTQDSGTALNPGSGSVGWSIFGRGANWINPDGTFHGTADIKGELKKMLDRGDVINSLTTTRAVGPGDLGYGEGTYTGKAPTHGYWVVTVKNKDGKWMIASDTDVEAPGAAGMPKEDKKAK